MGLLTCRLADFWRYVDRLHVNGNWPVVLHKDTYSNNAGIWVTHARIRVRQDINEHQ